MTQEERQLLLKDLCGRLPYGVMCDFAYNPGNTQKLLYVTPYDEKEQIHLSAKEYKFGNGSYGPSDFNVEEVKPYLRSMSSMTEEEEIYYNTVYYTLNFYKKEDWFNEHHFDYRGLIPMGLALEAPKDMYKAE